MAQSTMPAQPTPEVRVEPRPEDQTGPNIRLVLANAAPEREDIDLTRSFTSAIAHSLWMARAGDDAQNWIDAEHLLDQLFAAKVQRAERRIPARNETVTGPLPEPEDLRQIRSRNTVGTA